MPEVKFEYSPEVLEEYEELGKAELQLVGIDGNAWSIIGATKQAMRTWGYSNQAQHEMSEDATSGDYNHVIQTAMFWTDSPEDEVEDYVDSASLVASGVEFDSVADTDDLVMCVECGVEDYPENMKRVGGHVYCEYCAEDLED